MSFTRPPPASARESRRGPLRAAGRLRTQTPRGDGPKCTNPLLATDGVGRAKPTTYNIPGGSFAFGMPTCQEQEGAREAVNTWNDHTPSMDPRGEPGLSFTKLNRVAICSTPKEAQALKKGVREAMATKGGLAQTPRAAPQRDLIPSHVDPGFAYGRKVRPSTPMGEVINNIHGVAAEEAVSKQYDELNWQKEEASNMVYKIYSTKSSRGHAVVGQAAAIAGKGPSCAAAQQPEATFKLSRFKKTGPKVDSGNGGSSPRR